MIVEFRDRLQLQLGTSVQLPATIVFDHPTISALATHILDSFVQHEEPVAPAQTQQPADRITDAESVEQMTEQQAMEALLREVND